MKGRSLGAAMLQGKCPKCREGNIFPNSMFSYRKLTVVNERCPNCNAVLIPEPDFFYGAMYISYAFSVALVINVMIILNWFFDDPEVMTYILTVLVANLILLPLMLRYSKILYLYLVGKLKYTTSKD
jgi:phage FluMu protein Com